MKTQFISLIPACCLALAVPVFAEDTKHHDPDYNKDREYKGAYDHALTPMKFVHKALKSGRKEVSMARLATERAQDAEVKTLANNIVAAHEKANERLTAIALQKGYPTQDTNLVSQLSDKPQTSAGNGVNEGVANSVRSLALAQNGRGEPFFAGVPPVVPDTETSGRKDADSARSDAKDYNRSHKSDDAHNRLQSLQGAEFDKAFVRQMISDHNDAIALYTRASRDIEDSDVKAFASDTLPTLQEHLSEAERLAGRGLSASR